MRMVIFSKHDLEALTVVDVSESLIRELTKHGGDSFLLRMAPRLRFEARPRTPDSEPVFDSFKVVTIMCERFYRRKPGSRYLTQEQCWERGISYNSMFDKTWIGIADDDALTLMSTFLPGQREEVNGERESAYWKGVFEGWTILGGS